MKLMIVLVTLFVLVVLGQSAVIRERRNVAPFPEAIPLGDDMEVTPPPNPALERAQENAANAQEKVDANIRHNQERAREDQERARVQAQRQALTGTSGAVALVPYPGALAPAPFVRAPLTVTPLTPAPLLTPAVGALNPAVAPAVYPGALAPGPLAAGPYAATPAPLLTAPLLATPAVGALNPVVAQPNALAAGASVQTATVPIPASALSHTGSQQERENVIWVRSQAVVAPGAAPAAYPGALPGTYPGAVPPAVTFG